MTWKQDKVKALQEKHNNPESEKREADTYKQDRQKHHKKKKNQQLGIGKGRSRYPRRDCDSERQ
jgi:hypothetical protein